MCHSSTCPGTSYHMTQFYQAFPHVSTANDKCWGEKAWVRGYYWINKGLLSDRNQEVDHAGPWDDIKLQLKQPSLGWINPRFLHNTHPVYIGCSWEISAYYWFELYNITSTLLYLCSHLCHVWYFARLLLIVFVYDPRALVCVECIILTWYKWLWVHTYLCIW